MQDPRVSVVIVNWNQGHLLKSCLDALLAEDYAPLDITVVDNGSSDGSTTWLASHFPAVQLRAFSQNRGFARAFNWGARHTEGDFVLSLNPDTVVRSGFVRELVRAAAQSGGEGPPRSEPTLVGEPTPVGGPTPVGVVSPKLLWAADVARLDSTGLFVDRRRRPYDRGQGEVDRGQYDTWLSVFGACGAAALYRRVMLEDLALGGQYLDEDFFAYYEDADLAWRAQLRGWSGAYAPNAVAVHARGWGDTLRKAGHAAKDATGPRLALRNRYLMTIKNDAFGYFLVDLPRIVAGEIPRLGYTAVTRPQALLGLADLVRALPSTMRKRRQIRSRQLVDDGTIRHWFVDRRG
jgi:GT2 family glycosyltransferase